MVNRFSAVIQLVRFGMFLLVSVVPTSPAFSMSFCFWEVRDICEGDGVRFRIHPVSEENRRLLLPVGPETPSLWYMPTDAVPVGSQVRIYYQRVEKERPDYLDRRTWCLGILRSNGDFVLPDLGLFSKTWGGPSNVVLQRSPHPPTWGGFNVFQMVGDATRGYQLLYWDQPAEGAAGAMLASSTDGIHWIKEEKMVFTEHNDAYSLMEDPRTGEYLLYQTHLSDWPEKPFRDNLPGKRRVISIRRSKDLRRWSPQKTILAPDESDAPTAEFYLLKVFHTGNRYVGLLMKYYADPTLPGKHSGIIKNELIFSADGIDWQRPFRFADFGTWSYATPFLFGGDLFLPSYEKEGLALYRLRKDGFVSCGTEGEGSFWTRPFRLDSDRLYLNADCSKGSIEAELLDATGGVMEGFEASKCRLEGVDATDLPLRWEGSDLSGHVGKTIHLRFLLRNAEIYSLRNDSAHRD